MPECFHIANEPNVWIFSSRLPATKFSVSSFLSSALATTVFFFLFPFFFRCERFQGDEWSQRKLKTCCVAVRLWKAMINALLRWSTRDHEPFPNWICVHLINFVLTCTFCKAMMIHSGFKRVLCSVACLCRIRNGFSALIYWNKSSNIFPKCDFQIEKSSLKKTKLHCCLTQHRIRRRLVTSRICGCFVLFFQICSCQHNAHNNAWKISLRRKLFTLCWGHQQNSLFQAKTKKKRDIWPQRPSTALHREGCVVSQVGDLSCLNRWGVRGDEQGGRV